MPNAVWLITYKLKLGSSASDFLQAAEKTKTEVLSKQKGFISWTVLVDGDTYADFVTWECMEDAKKGETAGANNPVAMEFYSFIDFATLNMQQFLVEKNL